jgi:hypothetical protein
MRSAYRKKIFSLFLYLSSDDISNKNISNLFLSLQINRRKWDWFHSEEFILSNSYRSWRLSHFWHIKFYQVKLLSKKIFDSITYVEFFFHINIIYLSFLFTDKRRYWCFNSCSYSDLIHYKEQCTEASFSRSKCDSTLDL